MEIEQNSLIKEIAILAGAGLCCFKAEGKHEFLKDISKKCELAGFDFLGLPTPTQPPGEINGRKL